MFRLTIRDLLWLIVVVAVAFGWFTDRRNLVRNPLPPFIPLSLSGNHKAYTQAEMREILKEWEDIWFSDKRECVQGQFVPLDQRSMSRDRWTTEARLDGIVEP